MPLGKQIFDISEADTESIVEPDCMTDDFAWIPVSVITGSRGFHALSLSAVVQVDNALIGQHQGLDSSYRSN